MRKKKVKNKIEKEKIEKIFALNKMKCDPITISFVMNISLEEVKAILEEKAS